LLLAIKINTNDNSVEKLITEQEIHQKELEDNEIIQQKDDIENNDSDVQICNITIFYEEIKKNLEENKNINDVFDSTITNIYDPS
jgi:hypothetical protein